MKSYEFRRLQDQVRVQRDILDSTAAEPEDIRNRVIDLLEIFDQLLSALQLEAEVTEERP